MLNSCNNLRKTSSKSLKDFRPKLHSSHFHGQNFDFNPIFESYVKAWRSWFQRLPAEHVVLGLMVANVAVFFILEDSRSTVHVEQLCYICREYQEWSLHTLITHAFSHIDNMHVVNNMIPLFFFGTKIGRLFGTEYLLKLYLAGALGSSVFYLVHKTFQALLAKGQREMDPSKTPALGASGAVNAIVLLYIFLFPKATIYLNFFIPVPAILMGDKHISGSAHMGGAVVASLAWALVRRGRF